jgi:hypothetical protein
MASAILATSPFLALGALACPIGMGVMMWVMARGSRSKPSSSETQPPETLEDLRREHERLGAQIDEVEQSQIDAERTEPAGPLRASRPTEVAAAGARDNLDR